MLRLDDLQCNNLAVYQDKDLYAFTSDSVILANFVKIKKNEIAVEIGAGCGVVSLLALEKNKNLGKIYAFEMQSEMFEICEKNIKYNKKQEKIAVFCEKIQNFSKYLQKNSVDVVFCNPPYFKSKGLLSPNKVRDIARRDENLPIEDLCKCACQMLKSGGKFYCVYCAERSVELLCMLKKYNIAVKRMFFTENGKGKIVLVVLQAEKDAKDGVVVLPNLKTNDGDGKFLQELTTRKFM